jgi:aspartate-semialdehyde dehydrogenase
MYGEKIFRFVPLNEKLLKDEFDYVIFASGDDISFEWAPKFKDKGSIVIDNSNAFRRVSEVPLVVPEINFNSIKNNNKIISNPNCSTIQLVVVLEKLLKLANIDNVVVSSYQSVSGAGKEALLDLKYNTKDVFKNGITNNVIPQIGSILDNGFCSEEDKIMFETNKILNTNMSISATTVRVPIPYCHGESVYVKLQSDVKLDSIKNIIKCDYIECCDNIVYPTECHTSNKTYVCRLRQKSPREILFFVVADNLRRGAAYNAVEILNKLIENKKNIT